MALSEVWLRLGSGQCLNMITFWYLTGLGAPLMMGRLHNVAGLVTGQLWYQN